MQTETCVNEYGSFHCQCNPGMDCPGKTPCTKPCTVLLPYLLEPVYTTYETTTYEPTTTTTTTTTKVPSHCDDKKGPIFKITSTNAVTYSTDLTGDDLLAKLKNRNSVLSQNVGWMCSDGLPAFGTPSSGALSRIHNSQSHITIEIANTGTSRTTRRRGHRGRRQSNSNIVVNYNIEIHIQLKEDDLPYNFQPNMEVVYDVELVQKRAISNDITLPAGTEQVSVSNGQTNVDISSSGQKTGTCFRTEATAGYCTCIDTFVVDWEGKCIEADKTAISCQRKVDITKTAEEGHLQCDIGHEIRVLDAYITRRNTETCNGGDIYPRSWKKYQTCSSDQSLPYVKTKCDAEQSCQYKFYDNLYREWRERLCKKIYNYAHIRYACSELDTREPDTTETSDICAQCSQTGFTKERACEYQGLERSTAYNVNDYGECLVKCQNDPSCQAFTYYRREGTTNCYLKTGLLHQKCNTGMSFVFSRKCDLAPTCTTESKCALSTIPYQVPGVHSWDCNKSNGVKSCSVVCADGFDKVGVAAECTAGAWSLATSPDTLNVWNGGCQTCSGDPNVVHPIAHGGTWECSVSEHDVNKKVCKAKCPTIRVLRGSLVCKRDDTVNIIFFSIFALLTFLHSRVL